jgi:hypothetical protein
MRRKGRKRKGQSRGGMQISKKRNVCLIQSSEGKKNKEEELWGQFLLRNVLTGSG